MSKSDRTCPYCGHTFDTVAAREAHVPCPERKGDR